MDAQLPPYIENSLSSQESQMYVAEEIWLKVLQIQQLMQETPWLKIQITANQVQFTTLQEEVPLTTDLSRIQESSRQIQIIRAIKSCLAENLPNPEYLTGLLVKENLEYHWHKYQSYKLLIKERMTL